MDTPEGRRRWKKLERDRYRRRRERTAARAIREGLVFDPDAAHQRPPTWHYSFLAKGER